MELFLLICGVIFGIFACFIMLNCDEDFMPLIVYPLALTFLCGILIYFKYIKF